MLAHVPGKDLPDLRGFEDRGVELQLSGSRRDEDAVVGPRRQEVRDDVRRPPKDIALRQSAELVCSRLAELLVRLAAAGLATAEDRSFEDLFERLVVVQRSGTAERDHREVFDEVVLDRCSGQDDAAERLELTESLRRLGTGGLEAMAFIGDDEADGRVDGLQLACYRPKPIVPDDEDFVGLAGDELWSHRRQPQLRRQYDETDSLQIRLGVSDEDAKTVTSEPLLDLSRPILPAYRQRRRPEDERFELTLVKVTGQTIMAFSMTGPAPKTGFWPASGSTTSRGPGLGSTYAKTSTAAR